MELPEVEPGEVAVLAADLFNARQDEIERRANLTVVPPLVMAETPEGKIVGLGGRFGFWATLHGNANPYGFDEVIIQDGAVVAIPGFSGSGTPPDLAAYEVNDVRKLDGQVVWLEPGAAGDFRFAWKAKRPASHRIDCGDSYVEIEDSCAFLLPCWAGGPGHAGYEDMVGVNLELTWRCVSGYQVCDGYGNPTGAANFDTGTQVTPVPQQSEIWYGQVSGCVQHYCKHYYWESAVVPFPTPTGAPYCPVPPQTWVKFTLGTAIFYSDADGLNPVGTAALNAFPPGGITCNPFTYTFPGNLFGTFHEA